MKVSLITCTFNSASTIADTIQSVNIQTYENIEHIIVDGVSTDNTLEIIRNKSNRVKTIISELDLGIYDAMNKGIANSDGDIIGFLHSDDVFDNNKVVSNIVEAFGNNYDIIYGNGKYFRGKELYRNWVSGNFNYSKLNMGWMPLHPTVYCRKKVYSEYMFNIKYKIASDYDFVLKVFSNRGYKIKYLNKYIVKMQMGGASTTLSNAFLKLKEDFTIMKKNGLIPYFHLPAKVLQKMPQLLKL